MPLDTDTVQTATGDGNFDAEIAADQAGITRGYDRLTDLQGKQTSSIERERAASEKGAAAAAPLRDKLVAKAKEAPDPTTIKEEFLPKFERPTVSKEQWQSTFGVLMAVSMLVGSSSRGPYNGVMSAMTGAMQGMAAGDKERVDEAMKTYKLNTNAIATRNEQVRRQFDDIVKKNKGDVGNLKLELDQMLAQNDMIVSAAASETKSISSAIKQVESTIRSREIAVSKLRNLDEKISHNVKQENHWQQAMTARRENAKERAAAKGEKPTKAGEVNADNVWSDAEIDFHAASAIAGNFQWRVGVSRNSQGAKNISKVEARIPSLATEMGLNPFTWTSMLASIKGYDYSLKNLINRQAALEQSAKKIDNDIKTLDRFTQSGWAGSVKLINQPINKIREAFSSPELSEFILASKIVATEYERMITGGLLSSAQLHVSAQEDAKKLLNENMTPEQVKAVVGVMKMEIENQRRAFDDQVAEQQQKRTEIMPKLPPSYHAPTHRPGAAPAPAAAPDARSGDDALINKWLK